MRSALSRTGIVADGEQGLTLIELMIVMVLTMVLMGAVYTTYQVQNATGNTQHEVAAIQQDLRAVLDIMAWDIRQAGCNPTLQSTAGLIINQTGPTSISFSMDLDENGNTTGTNPAEQVTYSLNGTSLQRRNIMATANSVTTLANNVAELSFTYFDANNSEITPTGTGGTSLAPEEAERVRFVDITVLIRSSKMDPDTHKHIEREMTRRIKMRNLGI